MLHKLSQSFLLGFTVLVALVSCSHEAVFDEQVILPSTGWFKNEAVKFDVEVIDTLQSYDFNMTVRHSTDYRYSNLYVFMTTQFPDGKLSRDTIECLLAAPSGKWFGNGWGAIRDAEMRLKSSLYFPHSGTYKFYIQQAMRIDTLKGIEAIGLTLQGAEDIKP